MTGPASRRARASSGHRETGELAVALRTLRAGGLAVVYDGERRDDQGALIAAASVAGAAAVNFMATHGRGVICVALDPERCAQLGLRLMVSGGEHPRSSRMMASIEARSGVTTGISAGDRARTMRVAAAATAATDLVSPGHVIPLRAHADGVLARQGHTEAAVDLARLAGLGGAGVLCEILDEDGSMARRDALLRLSAEHAVPFVTIDDLVKYRRARHAESPPAALRSPSKPDAMRSTSRVPS